MVVVDDLSSGRREQVHSAARFYQADIREPGINAIFQSERPDVVSHHAAQMDVRRSVRDPQLDISINIVGTVIAELIDLPFHQPAIRNPQSPNF